MRKYYLIIYQDMLTENVRFTNKIELVKFLKKNKFKLSIPEMGRYSNGRNIIDVSVEYGSEPFVYKG